MITDEQNKSRLNYDDIYNNIENNIIKNEIEILQIPSINKSYALVDSNFLKNFISNLNIKPTIKEFGNIFIGVALMIGVMFILRLFVPLYVSSRVVSVLIAILYAAVGGLVYVLYMYKTKGINRIFGVEIVSKIKNKFIKK